MDIYRAAEEGDHDRVMDLVEEDAAVVHAVGPLGCTPLLFAARGKGSSFIITDSNTEGDETTRHGDHVGVVRHLLDHGADINHRNEDGRTALAEACTKGYADIVTLLLQRGADVTVRCVDGQLPLVGAVGGGHHAIVQLLLERGGTDVDAADNVGRYRAVHYACARGDHVVLKQLLEAGADPTLGTDMGTTALQMAETQQRAACIKVLEEWQRTCFLERARILRDTVAARPPSHASQEQHGAHAGEA